LGHWQNKFVGASSEFKQTLCGATSDVEVDIAFAVVTVIGTPVDALLEVDYVLPE
jgi:hypothetical protein